MHVKYILNGKLAPEGWDYFRVEPKSSEAFALTGQRAPAGSQPFGPEIYATQEAAIEAGVAWAASEGVNIVYAEIF